MLAIKHKNGDPYLYVFGGRGGDNTVQNRPQVCHGFSFFKFRQCRERDVYVISRTDVAFSTSYINCGCTNRAFCFDA
jgi:hypothetical protein